MGCTCRHKNEKFFLLNMIDKSQKSNTDKTKKTDEDEDQFPGLFPFAYNSIMI